MAKWVLDEQNGEYVGLPTKKMEPHHLRHLSPTAFKILRELAEKPLYPKLLAERLGMYEQNVYYYIRKLKKAGLIKVVKEENIGGVIAKYYSVVKPSLTFLLKEPQPIRNLRFLKQRHEEFLSPFIKNGRMNALFVVGSTEPHGIHRAKAEDAPHGMMIALFFGTFLSNIGDYLVKWDTEITREDLKNNLILIGGPAINRVTFEVNKNLPIRFMKRREYYHSIYSSLTKKKYEGENVGIIVKSKNPFQKQRYILVIAGRRYAGTQAAVVSLLKRFDEICKGNLKNPKLHAKVVEGIDVDADGKIDDVEILE